MKKQESIQDSKDFFQKLQEKGMIAEDDLTFIKELLLRINRIDLLTDKLRSSREEMEQELKIPGKAKISTYRLLLYKIAEELTEDDVVNVKFLLQTCIAKNKLQNSTTVLKIFIEMEKIGIMNGGDLKVLKDILQRLRCDLVKNINAYEEEIKGSSMFLIGPGHQEVACSKPNESVDLEEMTIPQLKRPYKMENYPHGYCVILNNYNFKDPDNTRSGADKDSEALKKVFTSLQFQIIEHSNLEAKQMLEIMQMYSKKDHSNMDCFICCLLSHGDKGQLKGTDWKSVPIKGLVSCFTGSNCKSLVGKPKLFFIQACQGTHKQQSISVEEDGCQKLETDASLLPSVPDWADILIGMATVEDYQCYRYTDRGSVYIQCLCKEMESLCPHHVDLVTILTNVNKDVGDKVFQGSKQMPEIISTLRRQLIF
ncbi:initiator caspase [Alligator mississippiensis]|uniref:Caspase-8 n=1 Tax=Alligator mississippiensis TaxID=8496 RepID=A0A151NA00_ALLMI|nr:initiator caspase [Alligator mississippiensis]